MTISCEPAYIKAKDFGMSITELFNTLCSEHAVLSKEEIVSIFNRPEEEVCGVFLKCGCSLDSKVTLTDLHIVMLYLYAIGYIKYGLGTTAKLIYTPDSINCLWQEPFDLGGEKFLVRMGKLSGKSYPEIRVFTPILWSIREGSGSDLYRCLLNYHLSMAGILRRDDYKEIAELYDSERLKDSHKNNIKLSLIDLYSLLDILRIQIYHRHYSLKGDFKMAIKGSETRRKLMKKTGDFFLPIFDTKSVVGKELYRSLKL